MHGRDRHPEGRLRETCRYDRGSHQEAYANWVFAGKALRIAHMGHVNAPVIVGTLSVIEMRLAPLHIPHDQAVELSGHQPPVRQPGNQRRQRGVAGVPLVRMQHDRRGGRADGAIRQWRPKVTQFRS